MTTIKQDLSKTPIKALSGVDATFSIVHDVQNIVASSNIDSQEIIGDCVMNVHNPSSYYMGGTISRQNSITQDNYVNLTPNIATISEGGIINRLVPGIAEVLYTEGKVTRKLSIDLRDKSDAEVAYEFVSIVGGTLAEHASLQIDNLIDNTMTMGTNGYLYSTQDHATPNYVRNINFWGASLDLTCISPWNSNGANRKAGTLVTPRHIIGAAHYEYPLETVIRFVTADNVLVERTVIGKKRHPDYAPFYPDLTIYTLDSDVPAEINFCKVMPSNTFDYISEGSVKVTSIPVLQLDQQEKGLIGDLSGAAWFQYPTDVDRLIFSEKIITGDSGNPAFLVVNDELVLITVWTYGGPGAGTEIRKYISDINQMIIDSDANAGVSTGYSLTEADFSSFPNVRVNHHNSQVFNNLTINI